jgi:hypothetical protein
MLFLVCGRNIREACSIFSRCVNLIIRIFFYRHTKRGLMHLLLRRIKHHSLRIDRKLLDTLAFIRVLVSFLIYKWRLPTLKKGHLEGVQALLKMHLLSLGCGTKQEWLLMQDTTVIVIVAFSY